MVRPQQGIQGSGPSPGPQRQAQPQGQPQGQRQGQPQQGQMPPQMQQLVRRFMSMDKQKLSVMLAQAVMQIQQQQGAQGPQQGGQVRRNPPNTR